MTQTIAGRLGASALLAAVMLLGTGTARATLVGAVAGFPDIKMTNLSVIANDTGIAFNENGSSVYQWRPDSSTGFSSLTADDFTLTVVFSSAGVFSSGSLSLLNGGDTLIAGNLFNFGYEFESGSSFSTGFFDAEYTIISSDPSLGFTNGTTGSFIATIDDLTPSTLNGNAWPTGVSFNNAGGGVADITGPTVPVPSTLALMAFGLFGASRVRRRRA